jgi:catechol 2,3-dioxygenase-like lactoylglutathione lyase family enzyme
MAAQLTKKSLDLGIITTNGPAMLAFYRDLLGLPFLREMPMPGGGLMHQLACGESVLKVVVVEKTAAKAAPGGIPGATGYRYITLTVSNLEEVVEECKQAGHPVVVPPRDLRPGVRLAIVADPDGNWVEFLAIG